MIRPSNALDYSVNKYDIRNIRYGSGVKSKKYKVGNGLYGNGLYGNGLWDSIKSGTKQVGNFVLDNADKIGKVVDVAHKTAKAGIDIARDVKDLHRTTELRKSQEESLRSKKQSNPPSKDSKSDVTDNAVFRNLRLQSEAIKKGKGLYLN
jgi:hypothetical protein